jgi:hypothetical protein
MIVRRVISVLATLGLIAILSSRLGSSFLNHCDKPPETPIVHTAVATNLAGNSVFSQTVSTSHSAGCSAAANTWHGIIRVPMEDMQTVADSLGGTVLEVATSSSSTEEISAILDQAQASGYQVILNMYSRTTNTNRPWYLDGDEWVFPQSTVELLQEIAHHPAMFAVYALHEPFDAGVPFDKQLELYQLLKGYTDLPVYSYVTRLAQKESAGIELVDGWCDLCGTSSACFRDDITSEESLERILSSIDADLDTQRRLMPNSQVAFQIQTYSSPSGRYPRRLPTPQELRTVRDHLCALNQPVMYYPWRHSGYSETLNDAPQLWSAIAEGCTCAIYLPLVLAYAD